MKNLNTNIIVSSVLKEFKEKLNESSRDNLLEPYLKILQKKKPELTLSQVKQYLLAKFVNEANIRSLSLDSNYYLAGVSRYYFEGKLTKNVKINAIYPKVKDVFDRKICQKLSALIVVLRNSYIDSVGTKFEQPEDFGTLPLEKLLKKYNKEIINELGYDISKEDDEEQKIKKPRINRDDNVGNGYTFEILYNYDEARKYNKYTEPGAWCITYGEHHYDAYINRLNIHYVIFKKNGFEKIPRKKTEGWTEEKPHDEYGNSLIALLQSNTSEKPIYITSRWNHGTFDDDTRCEADHAYTTEEFMEITGISNADLKRIYKIWLTDREEKEIKKDDGLEGGNSSKRKLEVIRAFKYAQMRINGGNFDNAFGDYENKTVKYLTGIKRIESIKQKINELPNTDGNYNSLVKQLRKCELNSIRGCEVTINNKSYYYLIDGNKILFETITDFDRTYRLPFSTSEGDSGGFYRCDAQNYKNVILCSVINGFMIYDTKKHKFVEIEGKKKFKFLADIGHWELERDIPNVCGFYEVKMSGNQMAVLNLDTNEPLILPNGHSWFEKLKNGYNSWGRKVSCDYIPSNKVVLHIIYDSSSGEEYWYDILNKRFFNPKDQIPINNDLDSLKTLRVSKSFENGYFTLEMYTNGCTIYSLFKNGTICEIDGSKLFSELNGDFSNGLIVYRKFVGRERNEYGHYQSIYSKPSIFDTENGSIYTSPETGMELYYSDSGDYLIRFRGEVKDETNKRIYHYYFSAFFNVKLKKWMMDSENPNQIFLKEIYSSDEDTGRISIIDENKKIFYFVPSETEPIFIPEQKENNVNEVNSMKKDKNTKRVIITSKQLNEVLKEANLSVDTGKANGNNATNAYNQLTSADKAQEFQKLDSLTQGENGITVTSQGTDENMPTLSLTANTLSDAANQVMNNAETLNKGCDFDIKMEKESKSFSKKYIEEARLRKMRNEGVVMTKKDLQESFINDDLCENKNKKKNKIEIKPENKGKFNATKKRTGKSTEELTHSKNPLTRKRAMFAKMAKRNWKPLKS